MPNWKLDFKNLFKIVAQRFLQYRFCDLKHISYLHVGIECPSLIQLNKKRKTEP